MKNDHSVSLRFHHAASAYDTEAAGQRVAAAELMDALPAAIAPRRILEIGCGTGDLTQRIHERFPTARIDAFDIAPGMVQATLTRLASCPRLAVTRDDAHTYAPPSDTYDLILSSSVLHWVEPVNPLLERLREGLRPHGVLGFSVMLHKTWTALHQARSVVAPEASPGRTLLPADAWKERLTEAGWEVIRQTENQVPQTWPDARSFLKAAHRLGVTGGALSHAPAHRLSRRQLHALEGELDRDGNGCTMSYHTGLFVAAPAR